MSSDAPPRGFSRRGVLGAAVGATTVLLASCTPLGRTESDASPRADVVSPPMPERVVAAGATQAGIARPTPPQTLVAVDVFDCEAGAGDALDALRDLIVRATDGALPGIDEPGDLTITVGVGRRVASDVYGDAGQLPPLPAFAREQLGEHQGGDLAIQTCASDVGVLSLVVEAVRAAIMNAGGQLRWTQRGTRTSQSPEGVSANALGFHDGIVNPRTNDELVHSVWCDGNDDGAAVRVSGASVMILRRLELDLAGFTALAPGDRELIVGRRADGRPLTGGEMMADVDLAEKNPDGSYVIPVDAHVRAAHPLATGRPLMLRRGYSFATDAGASGLLFICFQRDPESFIQTQLELDRRDALMRFTRCTGSGIFLILPGLDQPWK